VYIRGVDVANVFVLMVIVIVIWESSYCICKFGFFSFGEIISKRPRVPNPLEPS